jgi:hypothetical protein
MMGKVIRMKKLATSLALLLAGLASPPAIAQGVTPGLPLTPLGYCQLTSVASATALSACTGGIPNVPGSLRPANVAVIRTETQPIRYRDDGTAPTAAIGQPVLVADQPLVYVGTLSKVQVIQQSASATVDVLFYYTP